MADILKQSVAVKAIVLTFDEKGEVACRGDYEVETNEGNLNRSTDVALSETQLKAIDDWKLALLRGISEVELGETPKSKEPSPVTPVVDVA